VPQYPHFALTLAAFGAIAAAAPAAAQVQDRTTYTRNGSATLNGSTLVLTTATNSQVGSAFNPNAFATAGLQSLTATFNYTIDGGNGADGLAFVLQGNGPNALGADGGGIGYEGIANSLAATFRTFQNPGPGVGENGSLDIGHTANSGPRGTHDVTITYVAATQLFSILLDGTTALTQSNVDLAGLVGPQMYVGFTAGTGGLDDQHQINSFSFTPIYTVSGVPEPATLALTGAGLLALGVAMRRRRA
jgi:hypothetical protein